MRKWKQVMAAAVAAAGAIALIGGVMAFAQTLEVDVDRPGGDFLKVDLPSHAEKACMRLCASHNQCRAFTYVPGGGTAGTWQPDACWLKNSVPNAYYPAYPMTSGVKGVNFTADLPQVDAERQPYVITRDRARQIGYRSAVAEGVVPMLLIIGDTSPAPGMPADPACTNAGAIGPADVERAEQIMFGSETDATHSSVSQFYHEVSRGRYTIARAGVIGPVRLCPEATNFPDKLIRRIAAAGFRLAPYDRNGDNRIETSELLVVMFDNATRTGALSDKDCYPTQELVSDGHTQLQLCGVAAAGYLSTMNNPAHEIGHFLTGRDDLYGPSGHCWSWRLTVMSCTGGDSATGAFEGPVNFDPWNRIRLGWAAPRFASTAARSTWSLSAYSDFADGEPDDPVVIYDESRGLSEFYVVEYRRPSRWAHDAGALVPGCEPPLPGCPAPRPADGLVVWYVRTDSNGHAYRYLARVVALGNELHTPIRGDDIYNETTTDTGVTTIFITPGPNGVIDAPVDVRDYAASFAAVWAKAFPQPEGTATVVMKPGDPVQRLTWSDLSDAGIVLRVTAGSQAGTMNLAIIPGLQLRPRGNIPRLPPIQRP